MKKASIISSILYSGVVVALGVTLYTQCKTYQETLLQQKEEILYLKSEVEKYKKPFLQTSKKIQISKDINSTTNTQNKVKEKKEKIVKKIQQEIPKNAIIIKLPKVPTVEAKVPKVITIGGTKIKDNKEEILSMQMPIEKAKITTKNDENKTNKKVKEEKIKLVGIEHLGRVSTYLISSYKDEQELKTKLQKEGFEIIGKEKLKDGLNSIVFTNKTLKELAKKSPFIANLRVLINKNANQIAIQNPIYFAKAFLQDNFDEKKIKEVLTSINRAFKDLKNSSDRLKYSLLSKYQFMFGMPYYQDMITITKSKNSKNLIAKIPKEDIIFLQKISENRFLLGVKLPKRSEKFIDIIGDKNAFLLPYPLLIENGVAKILNPKYYIAISYPMLKMSQFMKISSIPDEIESDFERILK